MMSRKELDATLSDLLHRQPFQPFAIELEGGRRFVVGEKKALIHYAGSAVYTRPDGSFDFVDPEDVLRIAELIPAAAK